jgi:mannitol-1-/sugar-/sorbitol-6-/2-deoxyglucose-6-phosphatase
VTAIKAVIFDMDGLLIDTEPIWRRSEIEVFGSVGLHLTEEQCLETMGVRIAEVVDIWYSRHPWSGPSREEITRRIEERVVEHVVAEGEPKPGVHHAMETAREAGLAVAIASSSSRDMIRAVIIKLGLERYVQAISSGAEEPEGKPHPGVYVTAARLLGVASKHCLALEDSPNGVLSAKAAGMYCIAVPDPYLASDLRMREADLTLDSLEEFTPALLDEIRTHAA